MSNLDIKISIRKLSDYSGVLSRVEDKETLLLMIESFSKYVLELYGLLIEEGMNSRRYKGKWEPLEEEGYIEYLGVTPKRHILNSIREALESKKIGNYFIVRIDPSYKYEGSNLPLSRVLRAIESGTSDFNARPLIHKINVQISTHIMDLWKGYLTMKGVI